MTAGALSGPDQPIVYVNGKRYELPEGKAETTLLQYLRGTTSLLTLSCYARDRSV